MRKSHLQMLKDEVELARQGKIKYEPDPPYITIDDPVEFEKGVNAIRKLNGLPPKKLDLSGEYISWTAIEKPKKKLDEVTNRIGVRKATAVKHKSIQISEDVYKRLAPKAKRAKLSVEKYVEKYIEKLAGE